MATFLVDQGIASAEWIGQADAEAVASVEDAVAFAKAAPQPDPETLYEGLYSPEFMRQQGMTR